MSPNPATTADYAAANASNNEQRIKELEYKVEMLGRVVSHLATLHGEDFRELYEYEEELDRKNQAFVEHNKRKQ